MTKIRCARSFLVLNVVFRLSVNDRNIKEAQFQRNLKITLSVFSFQVHLRVSYSAADVIGGHS